MGGIPADFSIASHCCLDVPSGGLPLHTISNVDVNSSNGIRSGKPVRATRSASSTPLVWSWRASVVCSQQSGAFGEGMWAQKNCAELRQNCAELRASRTVENISWYMQIAPSFVPIAT